MMRGATPHLKSAVREWSSHSLPRSPDITSALGRIVLPAPSLLFASLRQGFPPQRPNKVFLGGACKRQPDNASASRSFLKRKCNSSQERLLLPHPSVFPGCYTPVSQCTSRSQAVILQYHNVPVVPRLLYLVLVPRLLFSSTTVQELALIHTVILHAHSFHVLA